jgi:phosphoglucomutase
LDAHVAAIAQAIADYRSSNGITGPLFIGFDTHAVSRAAERTVVEVLLSNGVDVRVQLGGGFTPTPAISHFILEYNRTKGAGGPADGIVITPSHNPPDDAGVKYNPPHGGPAESSVTKWIEVRANSYYTKGSAGIKRTVSRNQVESCPSVDYLGAYVRDLASVVDIEAIRRSGVRIGVHPLGGASVDYWKAIAKAHSLDITVVDDTIDPAFGFMSVDHDGKIRMDCSSPYAMAALVQSKDSFDVAIGNDPDADRHGIVTPSGGLMNPNHYLAVAIDYLFRSRPAWPERAGVGKTIVSSSLIDRVCAALGRPLVEVPVGFKWFVQGLYTGSLGFGGEESAGASFLCMDGRSWSTDKDGLILGLLAAEIRATTGIDPQQYLDQRIVPRFGLPAYERVDTPVDADARDRVLAFKARDVTLKTLGGDPIEHVLDRAPGNNESIGGLVIKTKEAWVAIRPSGTEAILKTYAESWKGTAHLASILAEVRTELLEKTPG